MHRDLIIGIVVSLALHSSIYFFSQKNAPPKRIAPPKEDVVQFEMPPLEEDKVDKVEELNDEKIENIMAPPSLVDVPSIVPVDAFVQPARACLPHQVEGSYHAIYLCVKAHHTRQAADMLAPHLDADGYVVSFTVNENTGKSEVEILDAKNIVAGPIGRVILPCRVPAGCFRLERAHGRATRPAALSGAGSGYHGLRGRW